MAARPTTASDAKLFHTQAEMETRKQLGQRVVKLRRMYWFGVLFLLTHVAPGLFVGGYGMAKSNEYDGVLCDGGKDGREFLTPSPTGPLDASGFFDEPMESSMGTAAYC